MNSSASAVFDEMGLSLAGEGQELRSRLQSMLDADWGHLLLLGENGTGRSALLQLFIRAASRRSYTVLERYGAVWRCYRQDTEMLSDDLWALFAQLKNLIEPTVVAVDDAEGLDVKVQNDLVEFVKAIQEKNVVYLLVTGHTSLARLALAGVFNQELWNFFTEERRVVIPEIRRFPSHIPQVVQKILKNLSKIFNFSSLIKINPRAMEHLKAYPWPGNIRQLHQVLERAALSCENSEIAVSDLPAWLLEGDEYGLVRAAKASMSLEDLERVYIEIVMKMVHGHKSRAAAILGINRKTLAAKVQRHNISVH